MSDKQEPKELNEPALEDDFPIYANYLYVVDGKVYRSDYHDVTARWLRLKLGATEIRRCDIGGRNLFDQMV